MAPSRKFPAQLQCGRKNRMKEKDGPIIRGRRIKQQCFLVTCDLGSLSGIVDAQLQSKVAQQQDLHATMMPMTMNGC